MVHIKIKDISISHGSFIAKHINGMKCTADADLKEILEETARDERKKRAGSRYNWQNTIMLSLEAIQELFLKTGLSGADMDMIVLASQLPEYIAPATSVKIHNVIGGKRECICYDVNSNGCGMTLAFDQISKYMCMNPHISRALLVGCDYINTKESTSGNTACALLLEKTEEESGICDAVSIISSDDSDSFLFPNCGFSNLFMVKGGSNLKFSVIKQNVCEIEAIEESVVKILGRNQLDPGKIQLYLFSQSSKEGLEQIRKRLRLEKTCSPYIGDLYGDTGTCGPFIALYEALEKKLINRGDFYLICAFGCSAQNITLLCRL